MDFLKREIPEETAHFAEMVEKDIMEFVQAFLPLYMQWMEKQLNEYRKELDEMDAVTSMFNLHSHAVINITLSTTHQLLQPIQNIEAKMQVIDKLEEGMTQSIKLLRDRIKKAA